MVDAPERMLWHPCGLVVLAKLGQLLGFTTTAEIDQRKKQKKKYTYNRYNALHAVRWCMS